MFLLKTSNKNNRTLSVSDGFRLYKSIAYAQGFCGALTLSGTLNKCRAHAAYRFAIALMATTGVLCGLALPGCAQQMKAPPVILDGNTFTLPNPFGLAFAEQPVEVPLDKTAPVAASLVVDENGKSVGQVSRDHKEVFLRIGFAEGQTERKLRLADGAGSTPAGLEHPVQARQSNWTPEQTKAAGTTNPNGVAGFYEISNGLCGVRIPATLQENALPAVRVPAPIIGVQYPDGEWAGRPDFRSLLVPAKASYAGVIIREDWKFTSFKSQLVEQGPVRTVAHITVTASNREEPYNFEVTVYAGEKFVKFQQLSGRINDWFLDLSLDKPTPFRPTRWRSGAQHHWGDGSDNLELLDRPGEKYNVRWDKGPGPTLHKEKQGEGENDLFSHNVWVEPGKWGQVRLLNKGGDSDNTHSKWAVGVPGIPFWYPWAGVGSELYALDPNGGANSPVAGLVAGPAGDVSGWEARDNPSGEAGFAQHIPSWLDSDPKIYYSYILHSYMENDRYQGIANREQPIFGIKFAMHTRSGSFFIWLGDNRDVLTDINDPKFTPQYRSPLWEDYSRFISGVANLQDELAWNTNWADPKDAGYSIEPEAVKHNMELARKGEYMGDRHLVQFWKIDSDADKVKAVDEFIKRAVEDPYDGIRARVRNTQQTHWGIDPNHFAWYTYDRWVAERLDELNTYFALGRKSQGGLLSEEQWQSLKRIAAFYFETVFDEDRAMFWNPGTHMNHGGGTMDAQGDLARLGIILKFPTWPDSIRYADRPVAEMQHELESQFGRWGAQFTSTHYSSLAAITQPLAGFISLQWLSKTQPDKFPDKFKDDPRLRHYAFFVLNRTGVKDPAHGNKRVPIAVGNGGPGWGHPAAAELASGFRHLDPQLSKWMMWDWIANGKSHKLTPVLPTIFDYSLPSEPYPFPAISTFPGVMTIHRNAPHTANETGVWITDGSFFNQHREVAEDGEVHIDALGKPLVTNTVSYGSPMQANEFYKNVIGTTTKNWDTDSYYWGESHSTWSQWSDEVTGIAEFPTGTYSSSLFHGGDEQYKGQTWRRRVALIHADDELPVIYIRDEMSKPGEYLSTFWLQTDGAITTPSGEKITPLEKFCPGNNGIVPNAEQAPSAVKVSGGLKAGVSSFRFSGHDWMKLYPKSYEKSGIKDIGPLVDTDVHVVNSSPAEAVVGHWRVTDGTNVFAQHDGRIDDRQYLRVKFNGTSHVTIFTPYFRGQRPADLSVTSEANDVVRVSYSNGAGIKRAIIISPQGYRIETNGKVTARAAFSDKMPERLYPQWNDVAFPGTAKP
jgi:hypothetical protein